MRRTKILSLTVLFAAPALAQTDATFLLVSSNTVSPSSPITTIEVWATWTDPGARYVYVAADYDLEAGDGEFVSGSLALGHSPPNMIGVLSGRTVIGARIAQVPICGIQGCPDDNPILLATYDWTTTDFTPRLVDLDTTNTSVFRVGILIVLGRPIITVELFPGEFTPGSGVINVVPAPTAWFTLALPLIAARRRRRCCPAASRP